MNIKQEILNKLTQLRQDLHKHPEVSHKENKTAERIKNHISQYNPNEVIDNIGGNGLLFLFKGNSEGKTIFFRAELDALPLKEESDKEYKSVNEKTAHLCGHDGHMAMLSGLSSQLNEDRDFTGTVGLLFQPAEETGEGAEKVLSDKRFTNLNPDFIFALHNIPGLEKGSIVVKDGVFAMGSTGMVINLVGKSTHAAYPEKGKSPGKAIAKLIIGMEQVNADTAYDGLAFATIIHSRMGSEAFGTQPGEGTLMLTLRAESDSDIEKLKANIIKLADAACSSENLKCEISYTEEFKTTVNNSEAVKIIRNAVKETGNKEEEFKKPFRWSEDFGRFTEKYKGAMFGLGAGGDLPELHNPDYDFPDDLIPEGVQIFYQIVTDLLYPHKIEDTAKHKHN